MDANTVMYWTGSVDMAIFCVKAKQECGKSGRNV